MTPSIEVIAGRCNVSYANGTVSEYRGHVVVVKKPDGTVLVHDAEGYQPVAWMTRADRVVLGDDGVKAWREDASLDVSLVDRFGRGRFPIGRAGTPVAACPNCGKTLVRASGRVTCVDCEESHGLPGDAALLESTCEDCGLPKIAILRGRRFVVCLDSNCEPLEDTVAEAFDRVWSCPDCGDDVRIRHRDGLVFGCDAFPDCQWTRAVPHDEFDGECLCGLPRVAGECIDEECERPSTAEA